jgi:hypothetical protein
MTNISKALRIPHLGMRQYLTQQTGYAWDADVINLRAALVGGTSANVWNDISSQPYPVTISDEGSKITMNESYEWL